MLWCPVYVTGHVELTPAPPRGQRSVTGVLSARGIRRPPRIVCRVTRNRLTALAVAAAALAAALSGCTAMPALAPTAPAASRPPTALPTPPMGFNDWNAFGCDV